MANLLSELRELVAPPVPSYRVLVVEHKGDGTSLVQFPGSGPFATVRGESVAVGSYAFIQGGEIRQQAPALSEITLDV